MNLTIAELNEVLYCLRQTLSSKPELLKTDIAQKALTKVYNELEHQVALADAKAANEPVNDLAGYTDARMNLNEVCDWLNKRGMTATADMMKDSFTYHFWTKDGWLRKDVIKDCFRAISADGQLFRELECDVVTVLNYTPLHEAHID